MRIAYLDCFAGISGDMFLGALHDAGVPLDILQSAASSLNLGVTLEVRKVDRSGISSTKVTVLENNAPAEVELPASHSQEPPHQHPHTHEHTQQPRTQHLHKIGRPHTHEHEHDHEHEEPHRHVHGRSLTVIRELIQASSLAPAVQSLAIHTFELLGHSEAKIHNVPVDQIHFHEVGAVDAIADIVCAAAGIVHLNLGAWHSSPVNVGGGMVVCAHGTFPVPAPATADLLRGLPTYSAHIQKELVTPTGAAILRALSPIFGPQPAMQVEQIGYGAGSRSPESFPNVLRLSIGEQTPVTTPGAPGPGSPTIQLDRRGRDLASETWDPDHNPDRAPFISHSHREMSWSTNTQTVTVLETALDDLTPQLLAYVTELLLKAGALDVMLTPVIMKKGRPGTLLTVLANPENSPRFEAILLRETTTLGIRIRQDTRVCLDRTHVTVATPYGPIRVKVGSRIHETEPLTATPEFEDCRAAATAHDTPLKFVIQSAAAAYLATRS